ncbi:HIRAN domain-containing protein, partial [Corynebacterium variabile]
MTATTYDLTDPRTDYCTVEAVGEFAYDRTLRTLVRQLGVRQREEVFFTASLIPEPDNPHSEHRRALSIRWNGQVIGYLPESDCAEYQQIRRIVASEFTPTVRARLWYYTGDDRTNRYWLSLNLRAPEQLVPLNDPPVEGWTLLPDGSTVQVTKEADHLDVLLDHVPPSGAGQLLVTLHQFTAGTRTHWEGIEVRLDGERIGELTKATSAKFLAAVQHFDAIGLTTVARATIKGSALSAEVTLQAAKAHELTDADLEPAISPLP